MPGSSERVLELLVDADLMSNRGEVGQQHHSARSPLSLVETECDCVYADVCGVATASEARTVWIW